MHKQRTPIRMREPRASRREAHLTRMRNRTKQVPIYEPRPKGEGFRFAGMVIEDNRQIRHIPLRNAAGQVSEFSSLVASMSSIDLTKASALDMQTWLRAGK